MLFGQIEINEDELLDHFHFFKKNIGTSMEFCDVLTIAGVLSDKRYYFGEALELLKDHITPSFVNHLADTIYCECKNNMDMKDEQELLMSAKRELRDTWEIKDLLDMKIITVDMERLVNDFFDGVNDNVKVPIDMYIKWDDELVKYQATKGDNERHQYHLLGNGMYLSARNIAWNEDRDITVVDLFLKRHPEFKDQLLDKNQAGEIEQPKSTKAQELSLMLESEKFEYSKPKDNNLSARL